MFLACLPYLMFLARYSNLEQNARYSNLEQKRKEGVFWCRLNQDRRNVLDQF